MATLEVPAAENREIVFSESEFEELLRLIRNPSLTDLVVATWETGCRPQESLRVESRHVDGKHKRWVISRQESKTKELTRVVYLNDKAFEITDRLQLLSGTRRVKLITAPNCIRSCFRAWEDCLWGVRSTLDEAVQ